MTIKLIFPNEKKTKISRLNRFFEDLEPASKFIAWIIEKLIVNFVIVGIQILSGNATNV